MKILVAGSLHPPTGKVLALEGGLHRSPITWPEPSTFLSIRLLFPLRFHLICPKVHDIFVFMTTRMRSTAVGHLDADCFYVSAERVRDAFLRGKPVGVLGNQGACVIAKSYEMKAAGVKTGEPIWEALVKCPEGIYVKRDFRWYEVLSRRMLDVVRELSPRVEYYSIDEFFFQAVPAAGQTLQELAVAIRDRIWEQVGRAGDGGHRPDADPGQADLRLGQAVRGAGGARPRGRRDAAGRPAGDRDHRDRRPAGGPARAVGHPHLPRPGPGRPAAGPLAADRLGRGPLVGAQRRPGAGDPPPAARAQGALARRQLSASRPPTRWSSTPGWCATSSG